MCCKKLLQLVLAVCICLVAVNSNLLAQNFDGPITVDLFIDSTEIANFLPGTTTSCAIHIVAGGEAHLYGGTFNTEFGPEFEGWFEMSVVGSELTIHGRDFWVGEELIPENTDSIVLSDYPIGDYGYYNVEWEDHYGNLYNIWLDSTVPIKLSEVGASPEIIVYPTELTYDYGDIEIGLSETYVVQIINTGTANLTVSSISLSDSADFAITSEPNYIDGVIVIAPDENISTDIEITYTPSAGEYTQATLTIISDDTDESAVEVVLSGIGVGGEITIEEQIQASIDFFDNSIIDGTIIGYAPNKKAKKAEQRVKALRNMLRAAGRLIEIGEINTAFKQLKNIARKTDGENRPPDFVVGGSVSVLNQMVNDIIASISL